jgi:hypothetical protein
MVAELDCLKRSMWKTTLNIDPNTIAKEWTLKFRFVVQKYVSMVYPQHIPLWHQSENLMMSNDKTANFE